jgi:beta-xylosidase
VWTCGWNERGIGYACSQDLIHWSDQQYLPVMEHEPRTRNCWAPEIFYDKYSGKYIIYWASTVNGHFPETQPYGDDGYNHRMYSVTTEDFKSFSETRLLYDPGFNVIDANIVADGDKYLLFMKNETLVPPQKNIRMATGNSPLTFGPAGEALTPNHYWAEGPTGIFVNGEWLVYFDKYRINEMGMIRSKDLNNWEDASHLLHFPKGAQHGFVTTVPVERIKQLFNRTEMATGSAAL